MASYGEKVVKKVQMDEVDDTDVHLCLRCNEQINGLENYIHHRKSVCNTPQNNPLMGDRKEAHTPQPALTQLSTLQANLLVQTSPVETPSVKTSPVETPSVKTSSVETPSVKTSSVETPSVKTSPVETPSVKTSPAQTSPVRASSYPVPIQLNSNQQNNSEACEGTKYVDVFDDRLKLKEVKETVKESVQGIGEMKDNGAETKKDIEKSSYEGINMEVIEEVIKESVEGTSGNNDSIQLPTLENYDYSRYVEAALLGNINTPYRELRANKNLLINKNVNDSKVSEEIGYKDDLEYDVPKIRRKYKKRNSKNKDTNQDINDGISDIEDDGPKKKKKNSVKQNKKLSKNDSSEQIKSKSTAKTWTCPICNKDMKAHTQRVHMRIHSNDKPFKCHLCPYACKTQSDMKIHIKRHLGIKEFKCTECDYATPKRSMLTKHFHRHQREKGLEDCQYQCDECGKRYSSNDGLKLHIRAVHENIKPFVCSFEGCKYAGVSNSELEIHIRTHTKEKPFLCTLCGYKAGNKNRLRRHMITHTDETPFKCDYPACTFVGKTAFRVRRHKKQHDPSNRLCCPYCSYTTFYLGNLRKHIKNTAKHKDTKVYLCEICKTFNTDAYKDLIDHYEEVHKGDIDVTVHSGGLKLGQFNHTRQQEVDVEEAILIIPEEAMVLADNAEFTL